ncbi:hypothetical protein N9148_00755 [bacterium]|nr:hypothetical protein [bacterium]
MVLTIPVYKILQDESWDHLGDYEFSVCPGIDEIVRVFGPVGDLDFMQVVRVEHHPVQLPRGIVTEDAVPEIMLFVKFKERFSG